jgi:hypothetical protein
MPICSKAANNFRRILLATGSAQNCSALFVDMADQIGSQFYNRMTVSSDEALIAVSIAVNLFDTVAERQFHY